MSFPNPDNYGRSCECGPENTTPPPSDIQDQLDALSDQVDTLDADVVDLDTRVTAIEDLNIEDYRLLRSSPDLGTSNLGAGLYTLSALTNGGSYNTAVGAGALGVLTGGDGNTAVGYYSAALVLTTGSNNTLLGYGTSVDAASRSSCICLGKGTTTPPVDGSLCIGGSGGSAMGNLVVPGPAGSASGSYLNIFLNGNNYKIALLYP